jgi:hypothetical protein
VAEERKPISREILVGVAIGVLIGWVSGFFRWLWHVIVATVMALATLWQESVWPALSAPITLPVWVGLLLALLAVWGASRWLVPFIMARRKPAPRRDYFQDNQLGVVWRWDYGAFGDGPSFSTFKAYCPNCDSEMVREYSFSYDDEFSLMRCQNCGAGSSNVRGNYDALVGRVHREVERKIRTGDWLKVVESQGQKKSGPVI